MSEDAQKQAGPPRKPTIFAENPFFNSREDSMDPRNAWGPSYVPGYSERKHEDHVRMAKGEKPRGGVRLQFVRISDALGHNVTAAGEGMTNYIQLGYRACGLDDLDRYGFDMPPAAYVAPDGTIRWGDTALFIVGADRAEYNREVQRELNREAAAAEPHLSDAPGISTVPDTRTTVRGSLDEIDASPLPELG